MQSAKSYVTTVLIGYLTIRLHFVVVDYMFYTQICFISKDLLVEEINL